MYHNQEGNIKNKIMRALQENDRFAFRSSEYIQRDKLRRLARKFFSSNSYGELERLARRLINFILYQHDKSVAVGAVLESLNNLELFGSYSFRRQRLHFTHQANVFLLGLYLYHNISTLQDNMTREMNLTTKTISIDINGFPYHFRYSGGDEYGEFLFRWRMAALSHDLGYGISLARNDESEIKDYLEEISTFIFKDIERLDDLWMYEREDLLEKLDRAMPDISLRRYMQHQRDHPLFGSVYYDHGIISALIYLRLMHEEYSRHEYCRVTKVSGTNILWINEILDTSILQSAVAIAMHNLVQHADALRYATDNVRIYDSQVRPLVWLLKVADLLQEWDKPPADTIDMDTELSPTNITICFYDDQIIVRNFDDNTGTEILSKINTYFHDTNIIDFR